MMMKVIEGKKFDSTARRDYVTVEMCAGTVCISAHDEFYEKGACAFFTPKQARALRDALTEILGDGK